MKVFVVVEQWDDVVFTIDYMSTIPPEPKKNQVVFTWNPEDGNLRTEYEAEDVFNLRTPLKPYSGTMTVDDELVNYAEWEKLSAMLTLGLVHANFPVTLYHERYRKYSNGELVASNDTVFAEEQTKLKNLITGDNINLDLEDE